MSNENTERQSVTETDLEEARKERISEEQKLERLRQRGIEATEQNRQLRFDGLFAEAIKTSGIVWHPNLQELRTLIKHYENCDFAIQPNGHFNLVAKDSGAVLDFQKTLEKIAVENQYLVNRDSIQHLTAANEGRQISKSDFKTTAEKSAYIAREGLDRWSALPSHAEPVINPDTMTAAEWNLISTKRKSELLAQHGEQWMIGVLKRK
jgi:hypothetical protein